jgi:hypothetical protein
VKAKNRLVASAGSLAEIAKLAGQYWYSDTPYELRETGPGLYGVFYPENSPRRGQRVNNYQVRVERGRYRFEAVSGG